MTETNTAVAEARPTSLVAITDDQLEFTPTQVAALQQMGLDRNTSPADLAVFFHHVRRTGLDPFSRQVYMLSRWTKNGPKATIQTAIDGFRLIARRAADKAGETLSYADTLWSAPDGQWRDTWPFREPPAAAKVTVYRNGQPFPAVAHFTEYAGTDRDGKLTQMWATKGALMLAKCAEALALRKAYPLDLSGLYTADEMGQADNGAEPQQARVQQVQQARAEQVQQVQPEQAEQSQPEQAEQSQQAQAFDPQAEATARWNNADALDALVKWVRQVHPKQADYIAALDARVAELRRTTPTPDQTTDQTNGVDQ